MRVVKINNNTANIRVCDVEDNDLEIKIIKDGVIFSRISDQTIILGIDTKFAPDVVGFLGDRLTWGDITRLVIRCEDDSLHLWADDNGKVFA